ncbi:MAG: NAD(P)H-hydrate dehydratase [Gammaproteobacteria bacterium]
MIARMTVLPNNLYRAEQVRELDRLTIDQYGIAGSVLMERAGNAAFMLLKQKWPNASQIAVICGTGNNGGDGFVVARLAHQSGLDVICVVVGEKSRLSGDAFKAFQKMNDAGLRGQPYSEGVLDDFDVVVDALLGTGIDREVDGVWRKVITEINSSASPKLSLDIPSGLCANTGSVLGDAVHASQTISFIGLKQGLFSAQGPEYCGEINFDDLQVPVDVFSHVQASSIKFNYNCVSERLIPRSRTAHKGQNGHVVLVGGDHGMGGAVQMAGEASARAGAGLVSIATRESHAANISAARPELMVHGVESVSQLKSLLKKASVVAIGPGLGKTDWATLMFSVVVEAKIPLVIDADALNLLSDNPLKRSDWVLTPHPGEAARLLGLDIKGVQGDRFNTIAQLQDNYGGLCLLKGAGTLILDESGRIRLCDAGNPGMACGGMGDVLTGIIAGFLAQRFEVADAVGLAVAIHAEAADRVASISGERGMMATDLYPHIHRLVNPR